MDSLACERGHVMRSFDFLLCNLMTCVICHGREAGLRGADIVAV